MALVEWFFEVGAKAVGSPHPVAIFLAGCRECLPEWEIQVAGWPRLRADCDRDPEDLDALYEGDDVVVALGGERKLAA